MHVQRAAVGEEGAVGGVDVLELEPVGGGLADGRECLVDQVGHGEHGRSGVEAIAVDVQPCRPGHPGRSPRSTTVTARPRPARCSAADRPARPGADDDHVIGLPSTMRIMPGPTHELHAARHVQTSAERPAAAHRLIDPARCQLRCAVDNRSAIISSIHWTAPVAAIKVRQRPISASSRSARAHQRGQLASQRRRRPCDGRPPPRWSLCVPPGHRPRVSR